MKKVLIIGGVVLFVLIVIVLIVVAIVGKKGGNKNQPKTSFPSEDLTLTYWRITDDKDALQTIFDAYKKEHKNVTINYVKKDPAEYETELVNAIASGSGPDLFQIKSDWLPKHQDKLSPMPEDYLSTDNYKKTFAPVAAQDLIIDNRIYGIPFYIDTLALFYNNKLVQDYNSALNKRTDLTNEQIQNLYISQPPQNWTDFIDQVKKLTNKNGTYINQAGAALGTSNNIESAEDVLSLFMLQNNTKMASDDKKTPTFNLSTKKESGEIVYPGTLALDFYTSFAKPSKETYSWNSALPSSTDAFIQGKTAMMFNYSAQIKKIKNLAPDLDFGVALMPQVKGVEKRIDYANYWPEAVNKNSKYPQVAWDFLKFASEDTWLSMYLDVSQRSSPKLSQNVSSNNVFPFQNQTANSWYKGKTATKVDAIFKDMITAVIGQNQPAQQAIDSAAQQILSLWQKE